MLWIGTQQSGVQFLSAVPGRGSGCERNRQAKRRRPQLKFCGRTAWICEYANVIAGSVLVRILSVFISCC